MTEVSIPAAAGTVAAAAATPVEALDAKTSALSDIIETGAGLSEGALELAGQLHVLNASMVEKGISIVELLATLAKNFAGVHI